MADIKDRTRRFAPGSPTALALVGAWASSCVEAGAIEARDRDGDPAEGFAERAEDRWRDARADGASPGGIDRKVCGSNDMQYVNAYAGDLGVSVDYVREHKGPVGVMTTSDKPGEGTRFCSGTLVATNVFLTTSFCVDDETVGRFVSMNYELSQGKDTSLLEERFYRISGVLKDDEVEGFALLSLDDDPGGAFGWMDIRETGMDVGEVVAIIQHPMGGPKQIATGHVSELASGRLYYDADTRLGSAGAGVLDADGLLAGIHTSGGCVPSEGAGMNAGVQISRVLGVSNELREISRGSHWQAAMDWCAGEDKQLFVGDFNGDDRDDMLCHDGVGNKWVVLADASGHFTGDVWRSPTYWCGQQGARLFVGDFDGDGRDDMLCHDSNGDKWVALADESGHFPVTSWSAPMAWCDYEGAQLFVGDFNGDGRDDMLCHDRTGNKWAAFADPSGQFPANSWFAPMEWCNAEGAQLFVGDFNGDGRDDMLCHDPAGDKSVALADESGRFSGESWHAAMGWCNAAGAQLFIGDFNGDGRDDMLCHEHGGDKWVTLADAAGHFSGEGWHALMDWCRGDGAELHVGKFNTDERSDMLCHDGTGHVWISNARKDGSF